jgi:hypothetical protein
MIIELIIALVVGIGIGTLTGESHSISLTTKNT